MGPKRKSYIQTRFIGNVQKDVGLVMLREVGLAGCVRVRVPTKAS